MKGQGAPGKEMGRLVWTSTYLSAAAGLTRPSGTFAPLRAIMCP